MKSLYPVCASCGAEVHMCNCIKRRFRERREFALAMFFSGATVGYAISQLVTLAFAGGR